MKVLYPITLDVKKTNVQKHIKAFTSEGGTRELIITLVSGNDTIELTNGYVVSVVGVKPDGTEFANTATVSDGKIHYTLTTQNVAVEGEVDCHIRVVKTNELLYTSKFAIDVEKNLSDEETETSSNEWTELINALNRVNNMSVIWSGEGAPSTDPEEYPDIQESNFYFDETNKVFYYAKSVGLTVTWEKIVNITELTALLATKADRSEVVSLISDRSKVWHGTANVNTRNTVTQAVEGIKEGDIYIQEDEDQAFKQVCVVYLASAQMFLLQPINNAYVSSSNPPSSTAANDYISLIDSTIWINSTTNRVYIKTASIGEPPSDTYVWQDLTGNRVFFGTTNPDDGTALGKLTIGTDYVGISKGDIYVCEDNSAYPLTGFENAYYVKSVDSTTAYLKKFNKIYFMDEAPPKYGAEKVVAAVLDKNEIFEEGTVWVYKYLTHGSYIRMFFLLTHIEQMQNNLSQVTIKYTWKTLEYAEPEDIADLQEQINEKQDILTAGSNVSISNNTISATDTTYSAGTNITIDSNNVISATGGSGGSYTAGNGIDISNDTISAKIVSSGNILKFDDGKLVVLGSDVANDISFQASMPYKNNIRQALLTNYGDYNFQPKLTAGTNITIDSNNVISASGGGLSYTFTDGLTESSGTVGIDLASGSKLLIDANDKLDVDLSSKQDTIDSNNKLDADLVDDSTSTNKFTNATEKQTWNNKADETTISTDTSSTTVSLTLADNNEYRYTTDLTSLTLTMPSGDFIASVVFSSGSTPTSMTYDSSIKWSGNDVTSNAFVPQANMEYEIVFWYNGLSINAVVRGVA